MARIRTYELDTNLTANDYLLGNDADSNSAIATKRFSLSDLQTFFSQGLGDVIPDVVPSGFVPLVSHDGSFANNRLETSGIKVIESPRLTSGTTTINLGTETVRNAGFGIALVLVDGGNGSVALQFTNYDAKWVLNTFSGLSFSITDPAQDTINGATGTFGDLIQIENKSFRYEVDGDFVHQLAITNLRDRNGNPLNLTQSYVGVDQINIVGVPSVLSYQFFDLDVEGNLTVTGTGTLDQLVVNGTSQFNGDVTLGTADPNTDPVNLVVHGNISIDDDEGGLIFGLQDSEATPPDTEDVRFTTDGNNLSIGGNGELNVATETTFTNDSGISVDCDTTDEDPITGFTRVSAGSTPVSFILNPPTGTDLSNTPASNFITMDSEVFVGYGVISRRGQVTEVDTSSSPQTATIGFIGVERTATLTLAGTTEAQRTLTVPGNNLVGSLVNPGVSVADSGGAAVTGTFTVTVNADRNALTIEDAGSDLAATQVVTFTYREVAPISTTETTYSIGPSTASASTQILCGSTVFRNADGSTTRIDGNGITQFNVRGEQQPAPQSVSATPLGGGVLDTLTIGNTLYNLPSAGSNIAEALPGLNENLGAPDAEVTTGRFFYARESGNQALFNSAFATQPTTAVTINAGEVTGTIGAADRVAFGTAFDAAPAGTNVFFVDATYTTAFPSAGDPVTGATLYELISYDNNPMIGTPPATNPNYGQFRFGILGQGAINIASQEVRMPNISQETTSNFMFYDTTDGSLHHDSLSVTTGARSAEFDSDGASINSFVFEPERLTERQNEDGTANASGNHLNIDLTGRHAVHGSTDLDFTAAAFNTYVLGNIPANPTTPTALDYSRTVTLPVGNAGDSIKFSNLSTFNTSNGLRDVASGTWRVIPAAGQRILGLGVRGGTQAAPADVTTANDLTLNDASVSFELVYIDGTTGWTII